MLDALLKHRVSIERMGRSAGGDLTVEETVSNVRALVVLRDTLVLDQEGAETLAKGVIYLPPSAPINTAADEWRIRFWPRLPSGAPTPVEHVTDGEVALWSGGALDDWLEYVADVGAITEYLTDPYSGAQSCQLSRTTGSVSINQSFTTLAPNNPYQVALAYKGDSAVEEGLAITVRNLTQGLYLSGRGDVWEAYGPGDFTQKYNTGTAWERSSFVALVPSSMPATDQFNVNVSNLEDGTVAQIDAISMRGPIHDHGEQRFEVLQIGTETNALTGALDHFRVMVR